MKQGLHECEQVMWRHRLPGVDREVRTGLAAQGMKTSVRRARPSSWRVVSTPLVPVPSLWLTWSKFVAAWCSWTGSITTVPWEPGKAG